MMFDHARRLLRLPFQRDRDKGEPMPEQHAMEARTQEDRAEIDRRVADVNRRFQYLQERLRFILGSPEEGHGSGVEK